MKRAATILLACALLASCNTVAGVGEDISGMARWSQQGMGGGY
ncbi:hypothetical protein [Paracoccus spongiarum]|uniref:Entericidin EcnA/B family protein n=1 Tax=Paracoccus spongiarum TaxID=3064387 RepID=A0ABT9J8M6_9RHOB|nr:hypothetical protein [Paracoccus sp. 2205BS29-5]MDP5306146.1 hypothetical protein [Paracoccus sp. 2205BS29-5]